MPFSPRTREYRFEFEYHLDELGELELTVEARVVVPGRYYHSSDPDNPSETEIMLVTANGSDVDPDAIQVLETVNGKPEWSTLRQMLEIYAFENADRLAPEAA
jgi:hypothetical protein